MRSHSWTRRSDADEQQRRDDDERVGARGDREAEEDSGDHGSSARPRIQSRRGERDADDVGGDRQDQEGHRRQGHLRRPQRERRTVAAVHQVVSAQSTAATTVQTAK